MFNSRPLSDQHSPKHRWNCPLKEYSAVPLHIPLKENWAERWCTLPCHFDNILNDMLSFEVRPRDVFIVTFMKCGTTWMQETAWLLLNNLDFEKAKQMDILDRSPFVDFHGIVPTMPNVFEKCLQVPDPRLIKSHLPANLLPQQVWSKKQKTIYVARNVKDVVVSSYHFLRSLNLWSGDQLSDFVEDFMDNRIMYTSFWGHIVDFWKMRHEPFIFFVTYEEMKRDLGAVVQRLCKFLERPLLEPKELEALLEHLSFENMKSNKKTNLTHSPNLTILDPQDTFQFMRRGIVGSFKEELSPELQSKLDKWSNEFLSKHGLKEQDIFGSI